MAIEVLNDTPIIDSTAIAPTGDGLDYKHSKRADFHLRLDPRGPDLKVVLDAGCAVTVAQQGSIRRARPDLTVHTMGNPCQLQRVGGGIQDAGEYVLLPMWIPAKTPDGTTILARIVCEVHLEDTMLMRMDIVQPAVMVMHPGTRQVTMESCFNARFLCSYVLTARRSKDWAVHEELAAILARTMSLMDDHTAMLSTAIAATG